jgi:hypothetical protein
VRTGGLAAAFLLSVAVPSCELLWPAASLARGSYTALALLPWFALAPLPRTGAAREPWRATAFVGACALPPLGLGLGLDLARGLAPGALAWSLAGGWLALVLWTASAELAPRAPRSRQGFAGLWLVLLPGSAALALALTWVPRLGPDPPAPARWLELNPLLWCHRWGRAGGLEGLGGGPAAFPLLSSVLVLALVRALAGPRETRA